MKTIYGLLTAFLLSLPVAIAASETTPNPIDKPALTIGTVEDYYPYIFLKDGKATGVYHDIITEASKRAGYTVNISRLPFKRLLHDTESGKLAGMAGAYYTPEREEFAEYIKVMPLTHIYNHLFALKENRASSSYIKDLKGLHLASKRGFILSPNYHAAIQNKTIKHSEVENADQLVEMLIRKRVDVVAHPSIDFMHRFKAAHSNAEVKLLLPPVTDGRPTFLAFSRKFLQSVPSTVVEEFNQAFESMKRDGTFKQFDAKYGIKRPSPLEE